MFVELGACLCPTVLVVVPLKLATEAGLPMLCRATRCPAAVPLKRAHRSDVIAR